MSNQVLGKGLASLIPQKSDTGEKQFSQGIKMIEAPIDQIQQNPHQPRKNFEPAELEDLKESIKQYGIIQPLIVTPDKNGYQLVAGERRLRAAKMAGLKTVPAIIRTAGELEKLELSLIENIQRQDLNPMEKAMAFKRLIDEFSLTHSEAAKRVGIARETLTNVVRLLSLPEEAQKAIIDGKINEGQAKVILSIADKEEQLKIFRQVLQEKMSVRKIESTLRKTQVKTHFRRTNPDLQLKEYEEKLSSKFATQVKVNKIGEKGKVEISFYSNEELVELVRQLLQ